MRSRYGIAEYENLWQTDPQHYGCVPLQQVSDSLQIGDQDVAMLIDKGALECFEIGDVSEIRSMVTLKSLLIFKSARASMMQDRPVRILKILTEAARSKKTLLYGDVMQSMGLTYQDAMQRQTFKKNLREATRNSALFEHGLLISALLVYKIQFIPDDDVFLMAQELGLFTPGKDSKTVFFKEQLDRIFRYCDGGNK
jgi:hypothetical protein